MSALGLSSTGWRLTPSSHSNGTHAQASRPRHTHVNIINCTRCLDGPMLHRRVLTKQASQIDFRRVEAFLNETPLLNPVTYVGLNCDIFISRPRDGSSRHFDKASTRRFTYYVESPEVDSREVFYATVAFKRYGKEYNSKFEIRIMTLVSNKLEEYREAQRVIHKEKLEKVKATVTKATIYTLVSLSMLLFLYLIFQSDKDSAAALPSFPEKNQ